MTTGKEILITGGSGSLGTDLLKELAKYHNPKGVRVYSRSELTQFKKQQELKDLELDIAWIIGDVRDKQALSRACRNVDIIINCAAMKRIDTCDANPLECIKTNVEGVQNVIYAALENNVEKVFHISTDKAVYPTTLYGSSKKCSEDLIAHANTYSGGKWAKFSCARYGNVFGSNGSVVQIFKEQANKGVLTITDQQMTRFWITLPKVAKFILNCLEEMQGGEIFVPKMPTMSIMNMAKTFAPDAKIEFIGIRGMEKLHECLVTHEESRYTEVKEDKFVINLKNKLKPITWTYTSDQTDWILTKNELIKMLEEL